MFVQAETWTTVSLTSSLHTSHSTPAQNKKGRKTHPLDTLYRIYCQRVGTVFHRVRCLSGVINAVRPSLTVICHLITGECLTPNLSTDHPGHDGL